MIFLVNYENIKYEFFLMEYEFFRKVRKSRTLPKALYWNIYSLWFSYFTNKIRALLKF